MKFGSATDTDPSEVDTLKEQETHKVSVYTNPSCLKETVFKKKRFRSLNVCVKQTHGCGLLLDVGFLTIFHWISLFWLFVFVQETQGLERFGIWP